jgi:hypothetical protein
VGEPQTSGSTACDWVLTRHPAVRESILRTTDLLRTCPVDALFLTGGITLGAYSPEMSDIDLVVVLPAAAEGDESAQAAVLRIVDDLPPGIGMLLVKRDRLPASEPPALQVEGRWSRPYALHAMDVILLRDRPRRQHDAPAGCCRRQRRSSAGPARVGSDGADLPDGALPGHTEDWRIGV